MKKQGLHELWLHQIELEVENEELTRMFDVIPDLICVIDTEHVIRRVNRALAEKLGVAHDQAVGLPCYQLFHGLQGPPDFCPNAPQCRALQEHREEVHDERLGGDFLVTCTPLHNKEGQLLGCVRVARDITEHKKFNQKILHSQKMEVVEQLAGGVAHDFNNLLMVIGGYASLLLKRLPAKNPSHRMVQEIRQATQRATSITRQLLTFSYKQIVQPRQLNLNESVTEVGNISKQLLGKDIQVVKGCAPDLVRVMADPIQIQQALMNLLLNARDAMPKGGTLTLETSNVKLSSARSKDFPSVPTGTYAMLVVRDTGTGMTPEVQSHLFEPFFSTKERSKGTGLGLSIVYGIIKQAGGHITVQSRVGKGSTFRILLPEAQANPLAVNIPQPDQKPIGGTETILLVEDEDAVRQVTAQLMESEGYHVIQASNAEEALRVCHDSKNNIHLMLSDVVMPGMNGLDLAKKITLLHPELKVILMSGYSEARIMKRILLQKDLIFLQKPIPHERLFQKLREVLDQPASTCPG